MDLHPCFSETPYLPEKLASSPRQMKKCFYGLSKKKKKTNISMKDIAIGSITIEHQVVPLLP